MTHISIYAIPNIAPCIKLLARVEATQKIINTTLQQLDITWQQANKKNRTRDVVQARQIIMYLLCRHSKLTLKEIGKTFNPVFDHTTVIHARQHIQDLIQTDPEIKKTIQKIQEKL